MACEAKKRGIVPRRGKASIEWWSGNKPQYYCMGYIDKMYDELLPVCQECRNNVRYAQVDLDAAIKADIASLKEGANYD